MNESTSTPYAAFILRVTSGALFMVHGLLNVFVFSIPGTVGYFESLGLPGILAYLTIFAEVFGGLALILGVATRVISLALVPVLLGAIWAHAGNGWLFANQGDGWEYPVSWIVAQIVISLLGSGAFALKLTSVMKTTSIQAHAA